MTVKNGYVALNADATDKQVQEAGVFYNSDNNSAYINFNFNNSIDLTDVSYGYTLMEIDGKKLQLDLQMVDSSNKAFISIPPEYVESCENVYGEVYLKYEQNTIMVGRFKTVFKKTLTNVTAKEISDVYVPRYEKVQNDYNKFKAEFEELGLGTFETSVKNVNKVLQKDAKIYPALKGLAEQDKTKLKNKDANNLPIGAYECTGLINAPENLLGHTVEAFTMGGSENRRQSFLIDSDTGEIFYKIFGSDTGGEDGARKNWMRINSEYVLWSDVSGTTMTQPVDLKTNVRQFNTIRVRAYINRLDQVFFGHMTWREDANNEFRFTINCTNIYDDLSIAEWLQSDLYFIDGGKRAQVKSGRIVRFNTSTKEITKEAVPYMKIVEIAGIM